MDVADLIAQLRLDAAKPATDRTRYGAAFDLSEEVENVPHIVPLLDDADPGVRALAAWLVASFAQAYGDDDERAGTVEPALPRVLALAAGDAEAEVRDAAVRAVQFFACAPHLRADTLPALERALTDPSLDVQATAAFGLARLRASLPAAAAAFGAALQRPEPPGSNLHQEACMVLTKLGRDAAPAVPGLLARLLDADDADLAVSIVEALGAAATPDAIAQLRDLDDPDSKVGRAAHAALVAARG